MTAVTIEQIQAKQTELATMIAQLLATPAQSTTIEIEEDSIELAAGERYGMEPMWGKIEDSKDQSGTS